MKIEGFDYSEQRSVSLTRAEWVERINAVVAMGGRRRVEKGETFVSTPSGRLLFEVYANIPAKVVVADVSDLL